MKSAATDHHGPRARSGTVPQSRHAPRAGATWSERTAPVAARPARSAWQRWSARLQGRAGAPSRPGGERGDIGLLHTFSFGQVEKSCATRTVAASTALHSRRCASARGWRCWTGGGCGAVIPSATAVSQGRRVVPSSIGTSFPIAIAWSRSRASTTEEAGNGLLALDEWPIGDGPASGIEVAVLVG